MKHISIRNVKKYILPIAIIGISFVVFAGQTIQKSKQDSKKGVVTYTDGRVKKKQLTAPDWQNAEKNSPVITGDRVRTYKRSRAELELLELDIIRMAPETTIDIVKLYDETKGKVKETKLSLQQGDIWAKIGNAAYNQVSAANCGYESFQPTRVMRG